ncbi:MAG: hypothetical protein M1429_00840 [Patescibacteria group bacterium]|nr:hypothetical protein [Patescibacteria group bacterium]
MNQNQPVSSNPQGSSLKWLLIILAVVVILGGGYLLYAKYGKKSSTATTTTSPTTKTSNPATTTTPTTTTDKTATWKAYTSSLGGYTVKYPTTWVYGKDSATDAQTAGYISQAIWYKDQAQKSAQVGQEFQVDITTNNTTKTLDQEVQARKTAITSEDPSFTFASTKSTIGTHSVATLEVTDKNGKNNGFSYIFIEKGKIFQISVGLLAEASTKTETVKTMIETITLQ